MARKTLNLNLSSWAIVDETTPNDVISFSGSSVYMSNSMRIYFKISAYSDSLKRARLYGATCTIRFYRDGPPIYALMYIPTKSFTASSLTWNNQPDTDAAYTANAAYIDTYDITGIGVPAQDFTLNPHNDGTEYKSRAARFILQHRAGSFRLPSSGSPPGPTIYKKLTDGTTDYVTIEYDDAVNVASQISVESYPSGNSVDPRSAQSFTWSYGPAGDYHCINETWTQASAKLFWRKSGASTWNQISISGSTKNTTVPAYTFPSGSTIQWYLQGTDTEGTTSTTAVKSFTTPATQITPDTYPTGSTVDNRSALTFSWHFASSIGNFAQKNAKLYWKVNGAASWNQISDANTTPIMTVPGYTFPAGKQIVWYLEGTDETGSVSSTSDSPGNFTTQSYTLAMTSFPSGSNVSTKDATVFSWTLSSSFGTVTQQSAKLYWKVSGGSTWTTVTNSTATKSISIPAYTFPTASTIQWYLEVTAADGTVTTRNTAQSPGSFTTVSPAIKATVFPSGSNIDPRNAITFSWEFQSAAGNYPQTSASLYWRVGTSGNYTQVAASGSTTSVTIPANTFPTASTIQWYLSGTDRSGRTTQTSATTFSTVSTQITMVNYPSGSKVDFGSPLTFTWKLQSAVGDYPQSSATFYWRSNTADPWISVSVSGNTQRVTIPANTFPSTSTIYWYISATDTGGHTSNTSSTSFTTASPKITVQSGPTSGYADPRNAITFAWYFTSGSATYGQQSAALHWRVQGATAWNNVQASGSTQSVTIPANTFPTLSTIEWYLTGTDVGGTSSETPVYSFSTTASTARAVCSSPVGSVEDGANPITLRWIVENSDGSNPSRTVVAWKLPTESSSSWHTITDTTSNIREYTVAANFFPAGPVDWRVIAYNRDSVAGPESVASFICIASPDPPQGLTATNVPITTISWQAAGQEAYEIRIDGETVRAEYSPGEYSWTVPEPLADGVHEIAVRIQGSYGLWSNWAETSIAVENVPDGSVDLYGDFGVDAYLSWSFSGSGTPTTIAVYRDGVWIGTANGATVFSDRTALGAHHYRVEYWFADGNYTRSAAVSGETQVDTLMIAELEGGPWLRLRLSEHDTRSYGFHRSRMNAMQHITAADYPILELSRFEDLSAGYDCAFRTQAEARAFEQLFGKKIILKSRPDTVIIGGLTELEKTVNPFYISYSFTVQQMHWEDFVR